MTKHSMRAKWNTANARLANKPFDDLFAEKPKVEQDPRAPHYNCVNCGKIDNCMVIESEENPGTGTCKICTCTVFVCLEDCIVVDDEKS